MTTEELRQVLDWADEGALQTYQSGCWIDVAYNLDFYGTIGSKEAFNLYRRKPTLTLRPWRPEEVPVGALLRNKVKDAYRSLILSVDDDSIYGVANGSCDINCDTFTAALEWREHSLDHGKTWLPCGVAE